MNKCEQCEHWQDMGNNSPVGICRRYAPKPATMISIDGRKPTVFWPLTNRTDSCGESIEADAEAAVAVKL